ncbi:hypothetical protein [Microbacterium sp. NPDC079176]|uniref:hypothetical protein n=1 Tax=Microbacterium sp. NPDC079176 TaxID=3154768 RepID=UPI0034422255
MRIPEDMVGFRGDPKWRDMSDYLVHFTKRDALLNILDAGHVEARNQFGWGRNDGATSHLRMSTCLSEVPVDQIERIASRRGHYGIGFRRDFIQSLGGARVWYAEEPQRTLLFETFGPLYRTDTARENGLWKLTPFIDDVTPGYDFTWEREWRVPGGVRFDLSDVQFLVLPRGEDKELFRNPAPDVPLLSPQGMEFWTDAWNALGNDQDRYVDRFLRVYANPSDYLTWDHEDYDYQWPVEGQDSAEAVEDVFDTELDYDAKAELAARLDGISAMWLNIRAFEEWVADADLGI